MSVKQKRTKGRIREELTATIHSPCDPDCRTHEENISGGRLQVDAELGYYIVNPQQQLPYAEEYLKPFLGLRAPSWKGTFGVAPPSSKKVTDMLQNCNIFIYAGHGGGSQFLNRDGIQKLNIRAVTFLYGCLRVTSRDLAVQADCAGMWHFYLTASCPMVIGSLWNVTDRTVDEITITTLGKWLLVTQDMMTFLPEKYSKLYKEKCEPDLLYALKRSHTSSEHYMATAALVARGLPVVIKVKVGMNTGTALEQESTVS